MSSRINGYWPQVQSMISMATRIEYSSEAAVIRKDPYTELAEALSAGIEQLKQLQSHRHEWNPLTGVCSICELDRRA